MNLRSWIFVPILVLSQSLAAQAQTTELSASRLDLLDQRGYFTPGFKQAVHKLVDARQASARARANEERSHMALPNLQKQSAEATAETNRLQRELALYLHPEDSDIDALQAAMRNPAISQQDRLVLAQAFVWSYPADTHTSEAEIDLKQIQGQITAEHKSAQESLVARAAGRAELVRRAKAGELSLHEWQDFLRDMSQEDLLTYLGPPQNRQAESWTYTNGLTLDPVTQKRVGLQIDFNGTRVINVAPANL